MAPSSPVPRSHSRASFYSTTTYHSFQDVELYEPGTQPEVGNTASARDNRSSQTKNAPVRRLRPSRKEEEIGQRPSSFQMVRQDSGYESSSTPPRNSQSPKRYRYTRQNSSPASIDSHTRTSRQQRPTLRRSGTSKPGGPTSHVSARSSLNMPRSTPQSLPAPQSRHSYFQFPSPDHLDHSAYRDLNADQTAPVTITVNADDVKGPSSAYTARVDSPVPLPPQTTHYWTSDRTRRLEYAAIDAASRGVRGWVMRNVVPECFVPREKRRVGFDDDTGSVRRYRLDLEIECPEDSVPPSPVGEKSRGFRARAKRSWWDKVRGRA